MGSDPSETEDDVASAERALDAMEALWRSHYGSGSLNLPVDEDEKLGDRVELAQFAYGIMASTMRTTRALVILAREEYAVESTAMLRSVLDQALALESLRVHGIHGVHAYGHEYAESLRKLVRAAESGFPLGEGDRAYIEFFTGLSDRLPRTPEGNRAINGIKTTTVGREQGQWEKYLYQMWLFATPLSKPSMKLADMYSEVVAEGERRDWHFFLDSDPGSTVDPRLVLQLVVPNALLTYAEALRDEQLALEVRGVVASFRLPLAPRAEWLVLPKDR